MTLRRLALLAALAYVLGAAAVALADDTSIFKDWGEVKKKGKQAIKERAEFWDGKGVTGKDLFWLARMWDDGGEDLKAIEVYEQFLGVADAPPKNRESAIWYLVELHGQKRNWDKVIPACERLRKEFPDSAVKHESFDEEGRARLMLGDRDRAIASFTAAADLGLNRGVFDLVDMYVFEGKVDEAKAAVEKYIAQVQQPGKEKALKELLDMLPAIGTTAPSIENAVSVGRTEAPKAWNGKPTLLFYWHMSTPSYDRLLKLAADVAKPFEDRVQVMGVSTYNKYNPQTKKVEADLAAEEEEKLWRVYIEQTVPEEGPPCILMPEDVKQGLRQESDMQITVIDKDGKIRWVHIGKETSSYRWLRAQALLKQLLQ